MKGKHSISNQPTSETVSTTGGTSTVVTHNLQQSARVGTGTGNNVTKISTSASATTTGTSNDSGSTTWFGKVIIFVVFPFLGGSLGLFVSYLQTLSSSSSSSSKSSSHQQYLDLKHEISIDRDFICPFLLTLALVVIITIQTSNFRSKEIKSILPWPTIKKVQQRRRVVVGSKSTTESSQQQKQKQKRKED